MLFNRVALRRNFPSQDFQECCRNGNRQVSKQNKKNSIIKVKFTLQSRAMTEQNQMNHNRRHNAFPLQKKRISFYTSSVVQREVKSFLVVYSNFFCLCMWRLILSKIDQGTRNICLCTGACVCQCLF